LNVCAIINTIYTNSASKRAKFYYTAVVLRDNSFLVPKNHSKSSQNPSTVVRCFFGKNPIFPKPIRRRPEHDPKKWVFKPVKSSQNRSSFLQVPEIGKFCNIFVLLTNKNAQNFGFDI